MAGAQEAQVEAEVVQAEAEVQAAAEEVEAVLEEPAGQDRGLPGGRGNRPEEGRKPGNKCSSNSKSR